jgi:hypothetical protein
MGKKILQQGQGFPLKDDATQIKHNCHEQLSKIQEIMD